MKITASDSRIPVLLIGGLAMRSRELLCLNRIDLSKFQLLYFDNLGIGDAESVHGELTIQMQAERLWKLVGDAGDIRPRKIALFGISMGAMIAAKMAALHPTRVSQLIVAATSPNIPAQSEAFPDGLANDFLSVRTPAQLNTAVDIAFGASCKRNRPEIRDTYFKYRLSGENLQKFSQFAQQLQSILRFDGLNTYIAIRNSKVRTLVVAGGEDELFPIAHSRDIQKLTGGELITLDGIGHMIHLEAPKELSSLINKFASGPLVSDA